MRFILPGSSWEWKGQRLGSCSALQPGSARVAAGLAAPVLPSVLTAGTAWVQL